MTSLLILRGHAFRPAGHLRNWAVDWRRGLDSQKRFVIDPLRSRGRLDVICCTYPTEHDGQVIRDYGAELFIKGDAGATQKATTLKALDAAIQLQKVAGRYDFVVMTRYDLEFLATPWTQPGFREECCNFLWREWNEASWKSYRRVPDAIHMMPGHLLQGFRDGVAETPSEDCLHHIYHPVSRKIGENLLNIMDPNGFHDSNSDVDPNPIYRMVRIK